MHLQPCQTPPDPTEPNRTRKKNHHTHHLLFVPFMAAQPYQTPQNPTEPAGVTVAAAAHVGGHHGESLFLPPFWPPNPTKPAHTLHSQAEVEITGAIKITPGVTIAAVLILALAWKSTCRGKNRQGNCGFIKDGPIYRRTGFQGGLAPRALFFEAPARGT